MLDVLQVGKVPLLSDANCYNYGWTVCLRYKNVMCWCGMETINWKEHQARKSKCESPSWEFLNHRHWDHHTLSLLCNISTPHFLPLVFCLSIPSFLYLHKMSSLLPVHGGHCQERWHRSSWELEVSSRAAAAAVLVVEGYSFGSVGSRAMWHCTCSSIMDEGQQ